MSTGGLIARVWPGTPAAEAGLIAGDVVLAASGVPLRDLIDWRWHTSEDDVTLTIQAADGVREASLSRTEGEWGVEFESVVFDGIRSCVNGCEFCFVSQLPPGLRPALYIKDDDFRLSFLSGNFITLTNLDAADIDRIVEQRLSPLHVSLHAVDTRVREQLLACRREDSALATFDHLHDNGIEFHVQLVLVPGVNDGPVLEESLDWLDARSGVRSVGVVPLGFTSHQDRYAESYGQRGAREVLDSIEVRRKARRDRGMTAWVHAADEFYLLAGRTFPDGEGYEGYPQYENGIGLVRSFLDGWERSADVDVPREGAADLVLCTGTAFAPVLAGIAAELDGVAGRGSVDVLPIENAFFGGGVDVTGLLTGVDLATSIRDDARRPPAASRRYLVPDIVLNDDGVTIDDLDPGAIAEMAQAEVCFVPHDPLEFAERLPQLWIEE